MAIRNYLAENRLLNGLLTPLLIGVGIWASISIKSNSITALVIIIIAIGLIMSFQASEKHKRMIERRKANV